MNYDTLLFGNGLTLSLFDEIKKVYNLETFEIFFSRFLNLEKHKRIKRNFYKILKSNPDSNVYLENKENIENVENFLIDNVEEINKNGFEVFIGKVYFSLDANFERQFIKDVVLYYYTLFNYWENLKDEEIQKNIVQNVISNYTIKIKKHNFKKIYTLNFDKYLDDCLQIKHIHGSFLDGLTDVEDLAACYFDNNKQFCYKIGFGTSGLEKSTRLCELKKQKYNGYDYSFLFDENIDLGNLLIFGIRFADTFILPDEIKKKHSKKEIDILSYVDGHIMERLDVLYILGRVNSIIISCHNKTDEIRYKKVFAKKKCKDIIQYVDSEKVFA